MLNFQFIYFKVKRSCLLVLLILFSAHLSYSQKLLPDTLFVDFKADSIIEITNFAIRKIEDRRNENPAYVSYSTKNKYLLIPVDNEIYTRKALAEEIMGNIPRQCNSCKVYHLYIDKFYIEDQKGRFGKTKYLVADIPVYEEAGDSLNFKGTLFYNYRYFPLKRKETAQQSAGNLLSKWHTDFKLDLMTIDATGIETRLNSNINFVKEKNVKSLYLNSSTVFFIGYKWWGLQGELFFSRPETNRRNQYRGGIIRYQNLEDYESFSIGRRSTHLYNRINRDWVFDTDLNFLIGFVKWKYVDVINPKLYQILDLELSSGQGFVYVPVNKSRLTMKIGLFECLNYIIDYGFNFNIGIMGGIGYKF